MYQNHVCQKTTKLLNRNIKFLTFLNNKYIIQQQIEKYSNSPNSNRATPHNESKLEDNNIAKINWNEEIKKKSTLWNNLGVWGITGTAAYLASHELGSLAYGLASIPLGMFHYDTLTTVGETFKRDIIFSQRYLRARLLSKILSMKDLSIGECFESLAQSNCNEVMIYFEETKWTYKQAEILSNKITNYFMFSSYEKGDVVAILVTNRPEYITLILGLAKLGVVSALINTGFKRQALLHAIKISDCKALIVSEDMTKELEKIKDKIDPKIQIFQLGGKPSLFKNYINLSDTLMAASDKTPEIIHKVNQSDPLIYIYSSGTTGLPTAAALSHSKFISTSIEVTYLLNLGINDVVYNPLPLHHPTGLVVGVGPSMITGIPVVVCQKFSASKYWQHCVKYKCTVAQYVGDMCRYLLLQPPSSLDKSHGVKKMIGSGLTKETWREFSNRFKVEITELYGPTDNNCSMINIDGKTGAVGFIPSFLPDFLHPASIIEVDPYTFEPVRDVDGLCKRCTLGAHNELATPGMLIGMINSSTKDYLNLIQNRCDGTNMQHIIENVFKKGDKAYLTGDILEMDRLGYIYFMNKNEDLYYYKGKFVNTQEVETVIKHLSGENQCAAYGVSIPGVEGKAGMVLIRDPEKKVDLNQLSREIEKHLPNSACPVFIRLTDVKRQTPLFNIAKEEYAKEGYDPKKVKDRLYYINRLTGFYEPLTSDVYQDIVNKKLMF